MPQETYLTAEQADEVENEIRAAGGREITRYAMQAIWPPNAPKQRTIGFIGPDGVHGSIDSVESADKLRARGFNGRDPELEALREAQAAKAREEQAQRQAQEQTENDAARPEFISSGQAAQWQRRGRERAELRARVKQLQGRPGVNKARAARDSHDRAIDGALWLIKSRPEMRLAYEYMEQGEEEHKAQAARPAASYSQAERRDRNAAPDLTSAAPGIYITGNTYPHRREIRAAGGDWDKGRQAWYLCCSELPASLAGIRGLVVTKAGTAAQIEGEHIQRADASWERALGIA